ncbi:hypothetical protein ACWECC_36885, partial [Streptomyces microflavus]
RPGENTGPQLGEAVQERLLLTLIMFLLLGASVSLNAALVAGILARLSGSTVLQAALVAGPAFIVVLSLFIAAWGNLT